MNGLEFPEIARSYVGVPFCHQGRCRETGLDCIGFLLCVLHDMDWEPLSPATTNVLAYSRFPDGTMLRDYLELETDEVSWEGKKQGDMVLMKFKKEPQHVGVLLNRTDGAISIIHSLFDKGVVEHILDASWEHRITGIFRLKETA